MKTAVTRTVLGRGSSLFAPFTVSLVVGSFALGSLVVGPRPIQAQEISLVPVSSSGFATTSGSTIHLLPGAQRITFDIRVAGWDPGQTGATKLGLYQATIDSSGFSSGTNGVLIFPYIPISCGVDADCPNPDSFDTCTGGVCKTSAELMVDESRLDFVFHGSRVLAASDIISPDPRLGVLPWDSIDSATDNGTDRYAGTFILDVPADATGTFTIGFNQDLAFTFMADPNSISIPIALFTPAVVVVETSCGGFPVESDCNGNGASDACDIATGVSMDCNGNTIPDECEPDCNANGIADGCDIADGVVADCNLNGVPDSCDLADGTSRDCNTDGIPDECGTDCNVNGIADVCDLLSGLAADCNSNGQLDVCDIASGVSQDLNGNGVPDSCEVNGVLLVPVASSGFHAITDHTIQVLGSGQRVTFEVFVSGWDPTHSGQTKLRAYQAVIDSTGFASGAAGVLTVPNIAIPCAADVDCPLSDGVCSAGVCSTNGALFIDESRTDYVFFGIPTTSAAAHIQPDPSLTAITINAAEAVTDTGILRYAGTIVLDVSGDAAGTFTIGFDNVQTIFSSADGLGIAITDFVPAAVVVETGCDAFPVGIDCNTNGQADGCDIAIGFSMDADGNGIPDECESDCNGNGVVDAADITSGFSADCNANGIPDECDTATGTSGDCNADGIPDECGTDCNSNGVPDVCDMVSGLSADCNVNGQLDVCDLASGISKDLDGNGVPDVCDVKGLSLVPVAASGSHAITGDTIQILGAGQRVTFDIRVSGWDPNLTGQTRLQLYQARIDSAGFSSGDTGVLTLPTIDIPCTVAADCPGYNSVCTAGVCSDNGAFVVDPTRPDYVFFGLDDIHAVNIIDPDPVLGAVLLSASDSVIDDGIFRYAGTLVLDVPVDAAGTFTIGFIQDFVQSFYSDQDNVNIPITSFAPAIVVVRTDCGVGPGTADCNGNGQADTCDIIAGTSQDADGNGVPDECDIAQTVVPDGSRFLQVQLPANLMQDVAIVVQCAGGAERFAGFPSGGGDNVALLMDTKSEAAFLPAAAWASPVNVTGFSVTPSTDYWVCVEQADGTRSTPISVRTAVWGDVTGPVAGSGPDGLADFRDIQGLVACFLQNSPSPSFSACDLDPEVPNGVVDFKDIRAAVEAFLSNPYPYATPIDCQGP